MQISGVDYTRSVFINREERAMVFVQSSYETDAILSLYKGETKLTDRPVKLMQGSNPVTFNLDTTSAGTFDYRVTISAEGDISSYNNAYSFTQIVSPEKRVLAITGNWNDCPALVEMYKDSGAYIDVYEKEVANDTDHTPTALREKRAYRDRYAADDRINIHLMSDTQNYVIQPWSIEELCAYDEIVLSDIDISTLENSTEFVNNLDIAVSMFGKSLITLGNLRIQNAGVSDLATLGEMLPVRYGRSDNLPKLYTIVIDASRSMTNDWGNFQSAQSAATRLLDLMSEGDCVNIVSFDQNTHINITESAVKDRDYIEGVINGLEPTQGTDIGTALQAAYDLNTDANRFSERRVILISDGINYTGDSTSTISALAAGAFAEGVTTSVIDVGRRGDNADGSNSSAGASAARNLLMDIAEKGSGSADSAAYFYLGASDELSDEIFVQISERLYESIVERSAPVDVVRRSDEVLDGFPRTGVPDISGYVYRSSRDNAMNVLELTHVRPDTGATEKVPLYSYWSRGNGKVATFTSALSRDWLGAWETRDIENLFITNVLDVNTPAQKSDYPYVFSVLQEGAMTTVKITPATLRFYSTAKISIEAPDGQITEDVMVFDGTEYSYNFDTADVGKYTVNVTYGYNDKEYTATAPVTVSYKSEYDAFTLYEPSVLSRALGGKVSLDGKLSLENAANEAGTYTLELTIPLLITCAVLYVVDIVIRKLKWEDVKSFFASFKKSAKEEGGKS